MKIIEIKTTQNVVLQYELADLRERVVAFLIDSAILFFGLLIFMALLAQAFNGTAMDAALYLSIVVYIFYSLTFEVLNNGQTPGKMAMRIRVIKATSVHATFPDYAARWVFRLVDIFLSFGGIASILIASSSKSQRIGDIVANTTVVKLAPSMNLNLQDILNLHAQTSYRPAYMLARQLAEEDALLIKSALDRYHEYQNRAHGEALRMLADNIAQVLRVTEREKNDVQFLDTVLKDYVMLTR